MAVDASFAQYCCELLASLGPCQARRMFGGWGISREGMTVALVVDLGEGPTLWLKADAETRGRFEAAGCRRFTYMAKGKPRSVDYYSAPEDALESPQLMAPWARQALACAVKARSRTATTSQARRATPAARRAAAPAPKASARRRSARG